MQNYMGSTTEDQFAISFLLYYLKQHHPLPDKLIEEYRKNCLVVEVKKSKYILSPVDNNKFLYYIVRGTARGFIKDRGKEITTWFAFENEIMGAAQHPNENAHYSAEYIHALENCLLVCVPYSLIDRMYEQFREANIIGRKLLALQYFAASQRSILARIPNASDRYRQLLSDKRFVSSHIPLRYLASYLSIRLETLSRIKKKEMQVALSLKEVLAEVSELVFA